MVGRKILTVLLSVAMIFGVTGCSGKAVKKEDKVDNNVDFDEFCDELFKDLVGSDAMGCHFAVSDPAKYGIVLETEDKIYGTLSEEDIEAAEKKLDEYIDRLKEFRKTGLSKEQQLTCDTLLWYFEAEDAYDDSHTHTGKAVHTAQTGFIRRAPFRWKRRCVCLCASGRLYPV